MVAWQLPAELVFWVAHLSQPLHGRLAWRLLPLLRGLLFAQGRRTVASWLRAAGLGADFRQYYYFLRSLGRKVEFVASLLLRLAVTVIGAGDRLLFALDDTPTKRYGPQGRRGGHPPQPHPRPRRPEVPLRPCLGHPRLAGAPPALGRHRPAPACLVVCPAQGHRQAAACAVAWPSAPSWRWPPTWSPGWPAG